MLDLMATQQTEGSVPLYINVVRRILREMRVEQQILGGGFRYSDFKNRLANADLSVGQIGPLNQRLDTLESFMPEPQAQDAAFKKKGKRSKFEQREGTRWRHEVGGLEISSTEPKTLTIRSLVLLQSWICHAHSSLQKLLACSLTSA